MVTACLSFATKMVTSHYHLSVRYNGESVTLGIEYRRNRPRVFVIRPFLMGKHTDHQHHFVFDRLT